MKRIFALILAIVCLSLSITTFASPDNLEIRNKAAVLETLGIMENVDEKLDEGITRRDFVIAVGKMLGINIFKVDENRYFKDMTSDDRAWNVANALVDRGILTVGEDRLFRPDDVITSGEVACVLMRILGVRNVDYSVYFDVASAHDLISGNPATKMRYKDAVEAIYKALNTATFANLGETGFRQSGKTLMDVLYDFDYVEGIVEAVNFTSLYGDVTYGINTLVIDGTVIKSDINDAYSYLGCYVSVYYKEVNGEKVLADIFVRETKTNKVSVNIDDFSGFDSKEYVAEYYTDSDKIREIDIDKGVTVIRNGDNDTTDIVGAFESIENGEITFIDADRNNIYEIIIINSYENVIVRHIDTEDMMLYGKYGNVIDLSDETVPVLIVSVTGEEKTIKDISPDNVISYYEADNLKRLVISDNTINGEMTSVNRKNGYTVVKISGTEYVIDKAYIRNSVITLSAGSTVKASVDAYGKIADMEITKNNGSIYAWLITTAVEDGMDNRLKLMLYTENSEIEEAYVAKKISIDGARYDSINAIKDALDNNESGTVDGQLVLIRKNSDNEINYIDTAYSENEKEHGLFVSAKEESNTFFAGQMVLGPKIRINASSKLFIVPESASYKTDAEAYKVVNGNKFFADWQSYAVTAYRNGLKNTVGYTDAMVLKRDLLGINTKNSLKNIMMVKEINRVWDEESMAVRDEIVLLSGKSEAIYMCSEEYDVSNDSQVKIGNIIRVSTNPNGEMAGAELIFGEGKEQTFNFAAWSNERNSACGYVYDMRDGLVGLSLVEGEDPFVCLVTTNIPIMVYDSSRTDSVYNGNEGDLVEAQTMGYKVVVDLARGNTKSISVIKGE